MRKIKLTDMDGKTIHEGLYHSTKEALEYAVSNNIPLYSINLRGADLRHANLDGGSFENACFSGADLTGANLSEANFIACDFSYANLTDACLCYSNIRHCNFRYSEFSDTDIAMTELISCQFEGISCLKLNFKKAFLRENIRLSDSIKTQALP